MHALFIMFQMCDLFPASLYYFYFLKNTDRGESLKGKMGSRLSHPFDFFKTLLVELFCPKSSTSKIYQKEEESDFLLICFTKSL